MGVLYIVIPLTDECSEWLKLENVPHPAPAPANRYPTPAEMAEALAQLPGYRVEVFKSLERGSWYADVTWAADRMAAPGNMVCLHGYRSEHEPERFYIDKGPIELALRIAANLADRCGPLVVTADSDCIPVVVTAGANIGALVQELEVRRTIRCTIRCT
jgi:hypothetical protein